MSDLREEIAEYCFWSEWPEQVADEIIAKVQANYIGECADMVREERAKTIEAVCAWAIKQGFSTGHADTQDDLLAELEWQIKEIRAKTIERVLAAVEQCRIYGWAGNDGIEAALKAIKGVSDE